LSFEIGDFFPNVSQGLANIGFFFGAGCSLKAGYPLLPELTVSVIEKLSEQEVGLLAQRLGVTKSTLAWLVRVNRQNERIECYNLHCFYMVTLWLILCQGEY
jgi:hypothetical protein